MTACPTPDFYEALALMREAEVEIDSFFEKCTRLIKIYGVTDESRALMAEVGSDLSELAQYLLDCDRNGIYSNRLGAMIR